MSSTLSTSPTRAYLVVEDTFSSPEAAVAARDRIQVSLILLVGYKHGRGGSASIAKPRIAQSGVPREDKHHG